MLKVGCHEVKIKMDNVASINMFSKMQFREESRSEVFQEITFRLEVNQGVREWLEKEATWQVELTKMAPLGHWVAIWG